MIGGKRRWWAGGEKDWDKEMGGWVAEEGRLADAHFADITPSGRPNHITTSL